ncbi:hypothetical protein C8Q77DRAFT_782275 [Trametes polyzona]|nr:hypothetical protein C8Q77DRAFT_782275 [Trametes polyzona]
MTTAGTHIPPDASGDHVNLTWPLPPRFSPINISAAFHKTLLDNIDTGSVHDVKFWAFSSRRRDASGVHLYEPRPVFANKQALLHVAEEFFLKVLEPGAHGFKESELVDMGSECPEDMRVSKQTNDPWHDCDSDLDDEEETADDTGGEVVDHPIPTPVPPHGDFTQVTARAALPNAPPAGVANVRGHLIRTPTVAYKTLRAFVYYSQFGEVNLATLRSPSATPSSESMLVDDNDVASYNPKVPMCSPKSMYMLAHRWNIPHLKSLALDAIESRLSPYNIWEQLLSPFTSWFSEVEATEVEYLMGNIDKFEVNRMQEFTIASVSSPVVWNIVSRLMKRHSERPEAVRTSAPAWR